MKPIIGPTERDRRRQMGLMHDAMLIRPDERIVLCPEDEWGWPLWQRIVVAIAMLVAGATVAIGLFYD